MAGNDENTKLLLHANQGNTVKSAYVHLPLNNTIVDSGSGAFTFGLDGVPTYSAGKVGDAITLNGTNQAVNMDACVSSIDTDDTGSISLWFNADDTTGDQLLFSVSDDSTLTTYLSVNWVGSTVACAYISTDIPNQSWIATSSNLSTGTWYHVVLVQNGVSPMLYINGAEDMVLTQDNRAGEWLSADTAILDAARLGQQRGNNTNNFWFAGDIDDFRYYSNSTLSQAEVTALYNGGTGTENSIIIDASSHDDLPFSHMAMEDSTYTDDGTGGNWVDDAGTPVFAAATGSSQPTLNNALTLAGGPEALNVDALQRDIKDDTVGSIAVWVKTTVLGSPDAFYSLGDTNAIEHQTMLFTGASLLSASLQVGGTAQWVCDWTGTPVVDTWYHVVLVQDGRSPKLYVNGVEGGTLSIATNPTYWLADASGLDNGRIGCRNFNSAGNGNYFNGQIDDFRYYRKALTPTQVTNLYALGAGTETAATEGGNNPLVQTFTDVQIQESAGGVQTVPDAESFGAYATFDGTSSHFVVPDNSDWDLGTSDFTLDMWIRIPGPVTTATSEVMMQGASNSQRWSLRLDAGEILHFVAYQASTAIAGNFVSTSAIITDTQWHHVAFVRSSSTALMYVDGVSVPVTINTAWTGTIGSWASDLYIGRNNDGGPNYYFTGDMDDVRICTTALANGGYSTEPAVSGPSTRLLLPFDNILPPAESHMLLEDNTDQGTGANVAVDIAVPTYTSGKIGNAITLNGTSQALDLDNLYTDINGDTTGSISAWFNAEDSTGTAAQIFSLSESSTANNFFNLTLSTNLQLRALIVVGGVNQWRLSHQLTGATRVRASVEIGTWYHVLITQDGAIPRMYVNGVEAGYLETIVDQTAWMVDIPGSNRARLGCMNYATGTDQLWFEGQIDDFRYWRNTALSLSDAVYLYNSGNGTESSTQENGVSSHAVENFGVVKKPGGKWNSAGLTFDGTDDAVEVPASSDWNVFGSTSSDYTIDLQMYPVDLLPTVANENLVGQWVDSSNRWYMQISDGSDVIQVSSRDGGVRVFGTNAKPPLAVINPKQQYHIALVKSGQAVGVYLDGNQIQYYWQSVATSNLAAPLSIGLSNGVSPFTGNMDEVRVQADNYFVGAPNSFCNAAALIYDGEVPTENWLECDELAPNYIEVPDHADFGTNNNDFTIDFWFKANRNAVNDVWAISGQWQDAGNFWNLQVGQNATFGGSLYFQNYNGGSRTGRLSASPGNYNHYEWHHFAIQYASGVYSGYIDGVDWSAGNINTEGLQALTGSPAYGIGTTYDTGSTTRYCEGDIAEYRHSNVARYTATGNGTTSFTPETKKYSMDANTTLLFHGTDVATESGINKLAITKTGTPLYPTKNQGYGSTPADASGNAGMRTLEYLHLRMNETTGTNVLDSGTGANDGTSVNNTSTMTDAGQGGDLGTALDFNGTTDSIEVNAFAAAVNADTTGTYSFWINYDAVTAGTVIDLGDNSADTHNFIGTGGGGQIYILMTNTGGSGNYSQWNVGMQAGVWHHIVISGDGVTNRCWMDGVEDTNNVGFGDHSRWLAYSTGLDIGSIGVSERGGFGKSEWLTGKLDDFRYYSGQALNQFQVNKIYNEGSGHEYPITAIRFDGTGDHLIVTDDSAIEPGTLYDIGASLTDHWTLDAWICKDAIAATKGIFAQRISGTDLWQFAVGSSGGLTFYVVTGGVNKFTSSSAAGTVKAGKWHHVAAIKAGPHTGTFIDGVQVSYGLQTLTGTIDEDLWIGGENGLPGYDFDGYIEQAQIGECNKFGVVPLPEPFTHLKFDDNATSSTVTDSGSGANAMTLDAPITLGCNFNGADAAKAYTAETGQIATFVLDAELDTADKMFGSASLKFDATGDRITFPTSTDWQFGTGDFTFATWVKFDTGSLGAGLGKTFFAVPWSNDAQWAFFYDVDSDKVSVYSEILTVPTTATMSVAAGLTEGVWYHIAACRMNGEVYFFVDGTEIGVKQPFTASFHTFANPLNVGTWTSAGGAGSINGWMDDVLIIKGRAAWTKSFPKPTAELTEHGTMLTNAIAKTGDNAMRFGQATNDVGTCIHCDSLMTDIKGDTTGTFAMWLRPQDDRGNSSIIFSMSDTVSPKDRIEIRATPNLDFVIVDPSLGSLEVEFYDEVAPDNEWVHVVWVQDGVELKGYINGEERALDFVVAPDKGTWLSTLSASVVNGRIGCYEVGAGDERYYAGEMDDFRYYQNQALTPAQVKQLYNSGSGTEEWGLL